MGRQSLIHYPRAGGAAHLACSPSRNAGLSHFSASSWIRLLIGTFLIQDLSSYIIARTLGVVDAVKASTNDKPAVPMTGISPPSILIEDMSALTSDLTDSHESIITPSDSITSTDEELGGLAAFASLDVSMFSNEKLSGVGVFSPASSRPSSPVLSRRKLRESKSPKAEMNMLPEIEGLSVRKRVRYGGDENGGE